MTRTGKDSRNITSARAVRDAQRRAEMLTLRIEGLTLEQIGERMGVGKPTVSRDPSVREEPSHEHHHSH